MYTLRYINCQEVACYVVDIGQGTSLRTSVNDSISLFKFIDIVIKSLVCMCNNYS